jgi:general nucleoside transport system permease protein
MDVLLQLIEATIRVSTPLLLACLAGLYSERAGVFDIGLEGKMLAGAFFGAAAAAWAASAGWPAGAFLGLLAAIAVAVFLSLVHGFASITHRGNQIVSGVAINFLAAGSTIILGQAWFQQGGRTPALTGAARFERVTLQSLTDFLAGYGWHFDSVGAVLVSIWDTICWPLAWLMVTLANIDGFGRFFRPIFLGHYRLEYFAFLMVPITWWVLYRTRFGLRLRAVGENPAAVDTAGVSVAWLRYRAVICTGILTGMAGAFLSLAQNAGFVKDMSAGKGFIALAALIFAKGKPVPAMLACLLFGFLDAVSIRIQGKPVELFGGVSDTLHLTLTAISYALPVALLAWWVYRKWDLVNGIVLAVLIFVAGRLFLYFTLEGEKVPVQLVNALPFILTIVLLAGFIGKAIPPRAGGVPYVKER